MATATIRIGHWRGALGLALALSGCVSTIGQSLSPTPESGAAARAHKQGGGAISSRRQLPKLNETSGPRDSFAFAALKTPGLEAALNRWKAALERVPQAATLPHPRFNYAFFICEVETRVGAQQQRVGVAQMFPWLGKLRQPPPRRSVSTTKRLSKVRNSPILEHEHSA